MTDDDIDSAMFLDDYLREHGHSPRVVRGRPLRRLLTAALAEWAVSAAITDLVGHCESLGVEWDGDRPSKVVSDALRWEIEWGRVERVDRGRYRFAGAPRTTLHRIRHQARSMTERLADAA